MTRLKSAILNQFAKNLDITTDNLIESTTDKTVW